jgi:hypothetical protein
MSPTPERVKSTTLMVSDAADIMSAIVLKLESKVALTPQEECFLTFLSLALMAYVSPVIKLNEDDGVKEIDFMQPKPDETYH